MITTVKIPIPGSSQPYNFNYHLTHYIFAPWIREGNELVRLFKLESGKSHKSALRQRRRFVLVRVGFKKKPPALLITLQSKKKLTKGDKDRPINLLRWCFSVDEPVSEFYEKIVKKDRVLAAAAKDIWGAHLRNEISVFESVIGVVIAQNVRFQRIYKMMELLCQKFGESEVFGGKRYYTFPTPEKLARASLKKLRSTKVGYRDKFIKAIAQYVVKNRINLDAMRLLKETKSIREKLLELPGVGPYTADLVLAIGFGRPAFHLDLFSREALWQFYFQGRKVSDERLRNFAEKRWGNWKSLAMMLLTTNTDSWAKELGLKFRLKSGALSAPHSRIKYQRLRKALD